MTSRACSCTVVAALLVVALGACLWTLGSRGVGTAVSSVDGSEAAPGMMPGPGAMPPMDAGLKAPLDALAENAEADAGENAEPASLPPSEAVALTGNVADDMATTKQRVNDLMLYVQSPEGKAAAKVLRSEH
jgi:hypothetical protein